MTWFRVGGTGIPVSLKNRMNAVLNKKFGTSGQNYPPNGWPDDVNLLGPLPENTVAGIIANFDDGADDVPIKSGVFGIDYDSNGVSGMTISRFGKNLFDKDHATVIDGYISTTTFSAGNRSAKTVYIPIKGGVTYTISKTAGQRFAVATSENIPANGVAFTSKSQHNTSSSDTITAGVNDKYLWAWVYMDGSDTGTLQDMLDSVQIEVGSSPSSYASFVKTDYNVDFDVTIYGGNFTSQTGVLTSTKASDGSDLPSPVSISCEPVDVYTLLGDNNIYCDTGSSNVTYRQDIDLALAALQGSRSLSASLMRSAGPEEVGEPEENIQNTEEQEGENDAR